VGGEVRAEAVSAEELAEGLCARARGTGKFTPGGAVEPGDLGQHPQVADPFCGPPPG